MRTARPYALRHALYALLGAGFCVALGAGVAQAGEARDATQAFGANCFSPFMTASRAASRLGGTGARYDFYDLDPFSNVAPSPATGRAVTPGTDRRCEVSFDGAFTEMAIEATLGALAREGIMTEAQVPASYTQTSGTALLAARQLNPARVAVVHIGTRPGPAGTETFMFVERLVPSNIQN